jgi:sec-independent protein translocase protein TatB
MFDVGFWELAIIALVALLVFGPEKLPSVIRGLSYWYRKVQSAVSDAKVEIDHELRALDKNNVLSESNRFRKKEVDVKNVVVQDIKHSDSISAEKIENSDRHDSK